MLFVEVRGIMSIAVISRVCVSNVLRLLRNLCYSVAILIECVDYLSLFCVCCIVVFVRRVDCAIYVAAVLVSVALLFDCG